MNFDKTSNGTGEEGGAAVMKGERFFLASRFFLLSLFSRNLLILDKSRRTSEGANKRKSKEKKNNKYSAM